MRNHWDENLNVRDMIKWFKPKYVVELGAGSGENTVQYLDIIDDIGFDMITISTGECPDLSHPRFKWIDGISYIELENIPDGIEFCSIDTDHNYWTLKMELNVLKEKMAKDAIIVLHDTEAFALTDGSQQGYHGHPEAGYPDIKTHRQGLQPAIWEFLLDTDFRLYKHVNDSCGATALHRGRLWA